MVDINITHLKSVLYYDENTGIFTWLANRGSVKKGDIAGTITHGYITIRYNMIKYLAHRLAWLYVHGYWPEKDIDHINGNKQDNRICNLRESSRSENNYNRCTINISNKLEYRGVSKSGNNYIARIKDCGKTVYIGNYSTILEAAKAYEDYAVELQKEFYNPPEYIYLLKDIKPVKIIQSNSTGFTGVSKIGNKFRASIKIKGIRVYLGTFCTPEEAYVVYLDKKQELGRS